ncbi:MAG: hypothetical protein ACRC4W_05515 [Treponemataceae bacterium]
MKKNYLSFLLLLCGFVAFAEINLFGGFAFGYTTHSLKYEGNEFYESNIPLIISVQADYFRSYDSWLGFSFKTDFSVNLANSFEKRDVFYLHQLNISKAPPSFSFGFAPSVTMRYIFSNLQSLSFRLGAGYFFTYYNLRMTEDTMGENGREFNAVTFRNKKNAFGIDTDIYFNFGKNYIRHGIYLNVLYTFLEQNTHLYDGKWQQANTARFSLGYKIGGPFSLPHETLHFTAQKIKAQDEFSRRIIDPFRPIKTEEPEIIEATEEDKKRDEQKNLQADYEDFIYLLSKGAQKRNSPIIITHLEKRSDDAKKLSSLAIGYRNISSKVISSVSLEVLPFNAKNKMLKSQSIVINTNATVYTDKYVTSLAVFDSLWSGIDVSKVKIKSLIVSFEDGSTAKVNSPNSIILGDSEYKKMQYYKETLEY